MDRPLCCKCVYMFNCGNTMYSYVLMDGNTCRSFEQVRIYKDDDHNRHVIEQSDYIAEKASWDCPECRTDIFE